jgi:hypothetical protein
LLSNCQTLTTATVESGDRASTVMTCPDATAADPRWGVKAMTFPITTRVATTRMHL